MCGRVEGLLVLVYLVLSAPWSLQRHFGDPRCGRGAWGEEEAGH